MLLLHTCCAADVKARYGALSVQRLIVKPTQLCNHRICCTCTVCQLCKSRLMHACWSITAWRKRVHAKQATPLHCLPSTVRTHGQRRRIDFGSCKSCALSWACARIHTALGTILYEFKIMILQHLLVYRLTRQSRSRAQKAAHVAGWSRNAFSPWL